MNKRFKKANRSGVMTTYEIYDQDDTRYYFELVGEGLPFVLGDISRKAYDMQLDSGEIQEAGDA